MLIDSWQTNSTISWTPKVHRLKKLLSETVLSQFNPFKTFVPSVFIIQFNKKCKQNTVTKLKIRTV
jgi:hypothetical protein